VFDRLEANPLRGRGLQEDDPMFQGAPELMPSFFGNSPRSGPIRSIGGREGFALGGDIEMSRGDGGAFSATQGTTKRAILVGERNMDGDEEIVVVDAANPGHTEIIPLVAGAQQGGTFDASTIRGALAPVFGSLGFSGDVPTFRRNQHGFYGLGGTLPILGGQRTGAPGTLFSLGYRPRLIHDVETGKISFINSQGQRQWITSPQDFQKFGFRPQDVFSIARGEAETMFGPEGSTLREAPQIEAGVRRYPTSATPLFEPNTGTPLPDPRMLAGIWRFLDPSTRNVLISAYGVAGLGTPGQAQTAIEEATRFFTPSGTQTRAGSARFG
jgi:hypothetical protein